MSEFMCHLLEHRSRSGWPLGFVRVVRAERQGGKGGGYGSRGCEHYPAERMRYCARGWVSDYAIVDRKSVV